MNLDWQDEYNAFNTWKVLFHIDRLRDLATGKIPSPVTVDTDLSNACNQKCVYCNSTVYRKESGPVRMSREHALSLPAMYKEWGAMSTCIAGGGEPTLHPALGEFILECNRQNIEAGIISNGVSIKDHDIEIIVSGCRFLGISLDVTDKKIYEKIRGRDDLHKVLINVGKIADLKVSRGVSIDLCAKVIIHPLNYLNLYETAKTAKAVGFNAIQLRPVAIDNVRGLECSGRFNMANQIENINEQILRMWDDFEDENFKIYTTLHKFEPDLSRKIGFKKCRATPLLAVFGADGWVYCCFNVRGYEESRICRHMPDPYNVIKEWGSERHQQVLDNIDPVNRCIRCTYNRPNEIIEQAIMQDKMFWKFP